MPTPLAVYIHWPFCKAKCPYCDFNSHVAAQIDHARWRDAYIKDIAYQASLMPDRVVRSVFFGGGTPSLMHPDTIEACLQAIGTHWRLDPTCEITLEANPTSIEADKFLAFRQAGVTRVSVGVQALNDTDLTFLGREHSAREALAALTIARTTFDRFSFDLIYARPNQTIQGWEEELRYALTQAGGHLSLYQLTIEPQTPFQVRHQRGDFTIPDDDQAADLYERTNAIMHQAGYHAYEVSNYAQPGQECRHNLAYWHYRDYVGIGPGAHGRISVDGQKWATRGHRAPAIWLDHVDNKGHGLHPFTAINAAERVAECLMMGVRLETPFNLSRLEEESGDPWQAWVHPERIERMVTESYAVRDGDLLRITPAGRLRLNAVIDFLLDEKPKSSLIMAQ